MYRSNEFLKLLYILPWRKIFPAIYSAQERRKIRRHPILDKSKQIDYIYIHGSSFIFPNFLLLLFAQITRRKDMINCGR